MFCLLWAKGFYLHAGTFLLSCINLFFCVGLLISSSTSIYHHWIMQTCYLIRISTLITANLLSYTNLYFDNCILYVRIQRFLFFLFFLLSACFELMSAGLFTAFPSLPLNSITLPLEACLFYYAFICSLHDSCPCDANYWSLVMLYEDVLV